MLSPAAAARFHSHTMRVCWMWVFGESHFWKSCGRSDVMSPGHRHCKNGQSPVLTHLTQKLRIHCTQCHSGRSTNFHLRMTNKLYSNRDWIACESFEYYFNLLMTESYRFAIVMVISMLIDLRPFQFTFCTHPFLPFQCSAQEIDALRHLFALSC